MSEERLSFQAEVSRLLDIVAHSLYSDKEIFLRELISNASDACDRLRYQALTEPALIADDPDLGIRLIPDAEAKTLTVVDNGIGMNREELIENLGTIARSGTTAFLDQLTGDAKKDLSLIGQFGVGFYSAFMVSDAVDVYTRKAGDTHAWHWQSDGKGGYVVSPADGDVPRGTRVVLTLREGETEYLEQTRLQRIVQKYSDHIALPIRFGTGDEAKTLNTASALWTRSKAEVTEEQYKEFYHHAAHAFDEPWLTIHWRAEGMLEYSSLLFVPSQRPFDLYDPRRSHRVKLYVRRVFITDQAENLIPPFLRFLRGVVDSEDLPLNVSRELLQQNPLISRMRNGITKRTLSEITKKAEGDPAAYAEFWANYGAVLKEGLYEDTEFRDQLLKLFRFRSTTTDGLASLDDYIGRMKDGQEAIYFISGDNTESLLKSPQLEGFRARGIEVLLLTDPVDEFWVPVVNAYQDKVFKSVTRGGADLGKIAETRDPETPKPETADETRMDSLIALFKLTLAEAVKDVRSSERLTDSAVCLVADEHDMDIHLERLLKQHKQLEVPTAKRILELNPGHPLIRRLTEQASAEGAGDAVSDMAWLLLDHARVMEGELPTDPVAYARRLMTVMDRSLASPTQGIPG